MIRRLRFKLGDWLVRLGLWVMPRPEVFSVATGDYLSRMGDLYGVPRKLDSEYREELLAIANRVGRADPMRGDDGTA